MYTDSGKKEIYENRKFIMETIEEQIEAAI
jgi:hypothetical protein